ncbi:hypothetical protein LEN26_014853 [Aphanomyces euteiches]|nr:hypothetical protein LEN26_014853 [Aphanomyces euteiches]KAH9108541.1 hypothetical protein AeMF1_016293 [Aphanomyces euteiches]
MKSRKAGKPAAASAPQASGASQDNAKLGKPTLEVNEAVLDRRVWAPSFHSAFNVLALVRLLSALFNVISDCDETFNYWEPLHNLVHGFGFQTWEYSPVYALRSYLYLLLHALPAKAGAILLFGNTKLGFFYGLRVALALASAASEALFYRGIVHAFGNRIGRLTLVFLVFNSGHFLASTAFLPSSFVMYMLMLFSYAWMTDATFSVKALVAGVVAVLCGWPYVGVMCVPFFFDSLIRFGVVRPIGYGLVVLALVLGAELVVNYWFYHKWLLPALNIVLYNVLSSGSELYGTEPWHYYVQNLLLNFNVAAILAFMSFPVLVLPLLVYRRAVDVRRAVFLSPLVVWLAIMFAQAHKEERFLFPVYPLLCAAAAFSLHVFSMLFAKVFPRKLVDMAVVLTLVVYASLSVARVTSMTTQYGAPIRVYERFSEELHNATTNVTVCVGKEWHRFPSHFFFPHHARLQFIPSGFHGQLPGYFAATFDIPPHMNDQNKEEPTRFVDLATCDYVVDRDVPLSLAHPEERGFDSRPDWELAFAEPYLLADESHRLYRAFYVPFLTPKHVKFTNYSVYRRKSAV